MNHGNTVWSGRDGKEDILDLITSARIAKSRCHVQEIKVVKTHKILEDTVMISNTSRMQSFLVFLTCLDLYLIRWSVCVPILFLRICCYA